MATKKVFIAISGGVDSSVAAALLVRAGYDVTGVYFKTYKPDGNRSYCRAQGQDAQRVCEHLGIPFKVFDLEREYEERVFEYMIREYRGGRTPNPDIICNREIKFGVFAERAFALGAEYVATGHYAQVHERDGVYYLKEAVDTNKDQSYFLSQLSQEQLARTMFPLGELHKQETRALAREFGLPTAEKPDSQGICFIGHELDVKSFLKRYINEHEGAVHNLAGERIGTHGGVEFSTIGERKGFTISPSYQTDTMEPLFVIRKEVAENVLVVGTKAELAAHTPRILTLTNTRWAAAPQEGVVYECRLRHRGARIPCTLSGDILTFLETPYAPAEGQFLAVYDGPICLGGGVMTL